MTKSKRLSISALLIAVVMMLACVNLSVFAENPSVANESELRDAIQAAKKSSSNDEIEIFLSGPIELSSYLEITDVVCTLIINGQGHTIKAAENFQTESLNFKNNMINVDRCTNVTFVNITIQGGANNRHTLNVTQGSNVTIRDDVTLIHNGSVGAPLIVNASNVTVEGELNLETNDNSWYGINVDSNGSSADITFEDSAKVTLTGATDKNILEVENSNSGSNATVTNPENAGLDVTTDPETGNTIYNKPVSTHTHNYKNPKVTDKEYHTETCECGATFTSEHEFKDGVCAVCGYKSGDIVSSSNPQTSNDSGMGYVAVLMLAGLVLAVTAKKCR